MRHKRTAKFRRNPPKRLLSGCVFEAHTRIVKEKKKSKPKKALLHGGACEADVPLPENLLTEPITQKHRSQISAQ